MKKKIQNTEETIAKYTIDANLFRLGSTNPKKIPSPWMLFDGEPSPPPKIIFFSKVFKFTWKIWNRPNRKKNQISDFYDFYFWVMVIFVFKTPQFSMNFPDNSENKNRKIDYLFDSAHCMSSVGIKPETILNKYFSWEWNSMEKYWFI